MAKIKCIIVEDEPLAIKVLADYVAQTPFLKLECTFKDAILALEWLSSNTVDLIFLDIHLPKIKGLDFLKTLQNPPHIIITTAYHQYALDGFNLNVVDYILKPIEFSRFLTAVNKVNKLHSIHSDNFKLVDREYIIIPHQKKKIKVFLDDIIYVESQKEYVKMVTIAGTYLTKMSTISIEDMLPTKYFKRVHRSFIVSVNKIRSFTSETIELNGVSMLIPIGRSYRDILDKL